MGDVVHIPFNWFPIIVNVVMYLVGGFGAFIGVIWKFAEYARRQDEKIAALEKRLDDKIATMLAAAHEVQGQKIQRVYGRLDEYKNYCEGSLGFVRKEMCSTMHSTTATAVTEVKIELKNLSKEISELKMLIIKNEKNI